MSNTTDEIAIPKGVPRTLNKEKLEEIAGYLLEGLSEDEACVLAGFPPKDFKEIKQKYEIVALYLEKKKIEFKRKHLRAIGAKGNDKNSMWLLESILPDQFGNKRKGGDTTINVVGSIIKDVQKNNNLPVKEQDRSAVGALAQGQETITVEGVLK